jgi:hypothetical protein
MTAYLIVAYYNRSKWNRLLLADKQAFAAKHTPWVQKDPATMPVKAEKAAEKLFPQKPGNDDPPGTPDLTEPVTGLSGKGGSTRIAGTFASDLLSKVGTKRYESLSDDEKDLYVDAIYASSPVYPPVGWMEIVSNDKFAAYIDKMSDNESILWKIYDIEIYPLTDDWTETQILGIVPALNEGPPADDGTTNGIYLNMTPKNWS